METKQTKIPFNSQELIKKVIKYGLIGIATASFVIWFMGSAIANDTDPVLEGLLKSRQSAIEAAQSNIEALKQYYETTKKTIDAACSTDIAAKEYKKAKDMPIGKENVCEQIVMPSFQ